ncbi:Bbp16 family capsid cement protein [Acinetobacter sp.]|uniref:Bbp16 family capsid cement protein n=1 Tax=Acinetobacter sp. TaxID=472 RepID=UPI002FD97B39
MLIDKLLVLSMDQAITATATSTDTLDLQKASTSVNRLPVLIRGKNLLPTTATITVQLQESSDNSSWTTVDTSRAYTGAELNSGVIGEVILPVKPKRYVRLNYTVASGPFTAGTVFAHVSDNRDVQAAYPVYAGA